MLAVVASATLLGIQGQPVSVEVHVASGLPGFTMVGMPDTACREARDRVRAALLCSGFGWPNRRITVNLAPSAVRKYGTGFDLAIAVGVLVAGGELPADAVETRGFLGEVGLDGTIRRVPGVLSLVDALTTPEVVVAPHAANEAALVGRHVVRVARCLRELVDALKAEAPWPPAPDPAPPARGGPEPDLAEVRGQPVARRALEVAAAGGHHLLLVGPPGAGKTMLARRLPGLLPDLAPDGALEVTRVHSAAGYPCDDLVRRPPFRAPHHTASAVSIVGGGGAGVLRPGEASLAHRGVLFLDELGEFAVPVVEGLRQPLEEGVIRIARARASTTFPARFLLVAAMNPCPCGQGGPPGTCRCNPVQRIRYRRRLSGPLLDRFDLRLVVERARVTELLGAPAEEPSAAVAARVGAVRALAVARGVLANAEIPGPRLDELAPLRPAAREVLERALARGRLSARGLHRVRRVARTLADLDQRDVLDVDDVALALALRVELDEEG